MISFQSGEVLVVLERSLYLYVDQDWLNLENYHGQNNLENGVNRQVSVYWQSQECQDINDKGQLQRIAEKYYELK